MQIVSEATAAIEPAGVSSKKEPCRYLPSWEKQPESSYKTYTFDIFNNMHEEMICWLYNKKDEKGNDALGCKLCEKYQNRINSNGKINLWCTTAEQLELQKASQSQPTWTTTQMKERTKHEIAIQNLILAAVFVCQQDQSLNSFEKLCTLIEDLGVKLLQAELGGVSYRNDNAALELLRHVASYLHEETLEKIFENGEAKTIFYGILNDLKPKKTCWFTTDNAPTFKDVNNGVVAKLKRDYDLVFVELNSCAAHDNNEKPKKRDLISKLENVIGRIYQYFGSSATRTSKLKCWQNLLEIIELKFKKLFNICCTAIRDSIKPIMFNITPTNQALLATLQEIKFDKDLTNDDRAATDLLSSILNDDFLFMLHFHYDLHECVIGPSLNDYIDCTSNNNSYGTFQVVVECFLVLFEPEYLMKNKSEIMKSIYGRQELQYIRTKYKKFDNRCQEIIQKAYNTWSENDENRRITRTKLIIDVPDDYVPFKQARHNVQKRLLTTADNCALKPKKSKSY
ncbi:unnamed protein product [Rotaria sp. Silwood1]|nr:unnamed protein product [Rotaria sp. Silwood1]